MLADAIHFYCVRFIYYIKYYLKFPNNNELEVNPRRSRGVNSSYFINKLYILIQGPSKAGYATEQIFVIIRVISVCNTLVTKQCVICLDVNNCYNLKVISTTFEHDTLRKNGMFLMKKHYKSVNAIIITKIILDQQRRLRHVCVCHKNSKYRHVNAISSHLRASTCWRSHGPTQALQQSGCILMARDLERLIIFIPYICCVKKDVYTSSIYSEILDRAPFRQRRSPLIVTLSDPKVTPVDIQKLMEAGMNVARIPTSHSTKGDKIRMLGKVDKAATILSQKYGVLDFPVATCVELKTCIVKTGILENDANFILLKQGAEVYLTNNLQEYDKCTNERIFVDNPNLSLDVKVGMEISIAQDEIIVQCKELCEDKSLRCVVIKGGKLSNMCYVSARGATRTRPYITKKDLQIVRFALEYQVDMIIINYARNKTTIQKAKHYVGRRTKRPLFICGVCTPEGLSNIDDLIREADGIVLSREFLAYELEAQHKHKMGQIQKMVGAKCLQAGKPFYLCGGVFREALIHGNISNHEIADVTNALLDGVTGFVLKDCDDIELILKVIKVMTDLCCFVEPFTNAKTDFWRILDETKMPINAAEAAAMSCALAANQTSARVIVLPTVTGKTAKGLMRYRPNCIVLTVSNKPSTTRLLMTYRCVVPLTYYTPSGITWQKTIESKINFAIEYAVKNGWLEYGDPYIALYKGSDCSSFCDTVRILNVIIMKRAFVECDDGEDES
ncbi:hypothetical protein K1T71_005466 [Dendrolimus kikuchii]|uniref:Uncharacterized protein n=1 Tax=Dendrolimus kikuchii TaxID=765133 RepID=A0ACC1D4B9_9NEOP|nr:hypothetical protein K1T71_005466 [Dendrolimus kikuchii]